jgi:ribosomal protein L37AE/L43A
MAIPVTCPACGEDDSLRRKFDAWACFEITGVDSDGDLVLSEIFDTQVFDDSEIECSNCDRKFDEQAIVDHLKGNNTL